MGLGASSKAGALGSGLAQPKAGGVAAGGGGGPARQLGGKGSDSSGPGLVEARARFAVEYRKQRDLKDKNDKASWTDQRLANDTLDNLSAMWERQLTQNAADFDEAADELKAYELKVY